MISPLKDKWIVVTRPSSQSQEFIHKLTDAGANAIPFPLLEIKPTDDIETAKNQLSHISQYQLIIFVSVNAVIHILNLISFEVLASLNIAAVGKKTAMELEKYGLKPCCQPQSPFNSEALLLQPQIQKLDQRDCVAIIRGENGRDFLRVSLEAQGAKVDYINVYKRLCPQNSLSLLEKQHQRRELDLILLTSAGSVSNLFDLQANGADNTWLNNVELMAGSDRIHQVILSDTSHSGKIYSATNPSDETLYQQLLEWAT